MAKKQKNVESLLSELFDFLFGQAESDSEKLEKQDFIEDVLLY